ncbi:RNA polymerase sigma-70 factor [Hydrocarboniphaga effusa]|uniref:RNA polymerase sigma-70 factor n=1 Tax=Hydrocarboniphaga effusa TaxID=243629 RepID=UPI003137F9BA
MDASLLAFDRHRSRLQAIAYRMLGSVAEAEEVVQDAWLRWYEAPRATLESTEAWLVTVTTRLAIDRLRLAKNEREEYFGLWLPEPTVSNEPTPEEATERADEVSIAFLALLERLTPDARAAFVLRELFDLGYDEVARCIGKTEAASRQLVSRAKTQLREGKQRQSVSPQVHRRLLDRFAEALSRGDTTALQALLAEDAELIGDGGGKVSSFGRPMIGAWRLVKLFIAAMRRAAGLQRLEPALVNGEWALLRIVGDCLHSVESIETDGQRVTRMLVQRNPDKLRRIASKLGLRTVDVTNAEAAPSGE